jgi:2-polyprenyl-6-methoxyphenol hydroxylase-like FAD-dependent oxidoreductase
MKHSVGIIGGGPVGLTLHLLLKQCGVSSMILERKASLTPRHPQAHFLTQRSLEILRSTGMPIDTLIVNNAPPRHMWNRFVYCNKLTGDIKLYGQYDHFQNNSIIDQLSPCPPVHFAQNKLVPLISQFVDPQDVLLEAQVTAVQVNSADRVNVETADGKLFEFDCVVGADGAKSVTRQAIGAKLEGQFAIQRLANIHFQNQGLSEYLLSSGSNPGPAMLYFIYNAERICVLVAHDLRVGEFVLQVPFFEPFESIDDLTPSKISNIFSAIGITGNSTVQGTGVWTMNAVVANSYGSKSGHIFLAGDAAHQYPPSGGFGLNSGLQDVHNLAWKMAWALKRDDSRQSLKEVLNSYETERKGIAARTAELSIDNFKKVLHVSASLGLNVEYVNLLTSGLNAFGEGFKTSNTAKSLFETVTALGRRLPDIALPSQRTKTNSLISSGQGLPLLFPAQDLQQIYTERGGSFPKSFSESASKKLEVGKRVPHEWLSQNGGQLSSIDLANGYSGENSIPCYTAFVRSNSQSVLEMDGPFASLPCRSVTISNDDSVFTGAKEVLVRPDGHVCAILR